jgi:hypothetical protein
VKDSVQAWYPGSFEAQVYSERIGYHVDQPEDLHTVVQQALQHGITTKEEEFIEGILPRTLRGVSGIATARELMKLLGKVT